jgi:hypothetical protein
MFPKKTSMAIMALSAATALTSPVRADELSDLKAQIRAQQVALEQMQAQLQAVQDKQTAQAAQTAAAPPLAAGAEPGYFMIPGTKTSMKIGGYIKLDAVDDISGNMGRSSTSKTMADMSAIPLDKSAGAHRGGQFNMSARESRLNVTTLTPTEGYGNLKTVLEGDFYGSNSSSGSAAFLRLRQAYGSLGPVLAGQTWSTFMDLDTMSPELLDFGGPVGASFVRQPQIRYTVKAAGGALDFAIESPQGDISNQTSDSSLDTAPDFIARYSVDPSWGHVSVAGLGRYLSNNNGAGSHDSTATYGVLVGVGISTVGKDMLTFQTVNGNGIGRYLNQGQGISAVLDAQKKIRAIDVYGGTIGYSHFWTDALRSNVAAGYDSFGSPSEVESLTSAHANLIWSPIPAVDVGLEYIWGHITYRHPVTDSTTKTAASSGSADRLQGSVKYTF